MVIYYKLDPFWHCVFDVRILLCEPTRWEYFKTEVSKRAAVAKRIAEKYNLPFVELQDIFDDACKRAPASY